MEILTVAVVTKPFNFEGRKRMAQAEQGIGKLREFVDSLIVIPNERLKLLTDKKITFLNAFQEADDVLRKGVQSICELITSVGVINLDFADVSTVMTNAGLAHMGVGFAKGKDKAEQAAKMAMSSPLLETNISGARGIVVNITASPDIGLDEIDSAVAMITDERSRTQRSSSAQRLTHLLRTRCVSPLSPPALTLISAAAASAVRPFRRLPLLRLPLPKRARRITAKTTSTI